jgi:hypothetical protein
MTKLFTAVSLVALMALPALAQDANTPAQNAPTETAPAAQVAPSTISGDISARDLLNESVKNAANETIGDINDVLLAGDGKVSAVIVGVGGFLGMGEKDVALPFDQLMFAKDASDDLLVSTSATKESLQTAPEYNRQQDRQPQ